MESLDKTMKIYFAGTPGIISREAIWQKQIAEGRGGRLLSFWDISQDQFAVKQAFDLGIKNNEDLAGRGSRGGQTWGLQKRKRTWQF